jgi:hypothetical protein
VLALQAEVTRAQEVVVVAEAARIIAVLAIETSAQDAVAVQDSTTLHVQDVEGWAALVEREA